MSQEESEIPPAKVHQEMEKSSIKEQPSGPIAQEENVNKGNSQNAPPERRGKFYMETLGIEEITYGFAELGYGTLSEVSRTRDVLLKPMINDCGCIEPAPKIAVLGARETGMALTAALLAMNIAYNIVICELNENVAEVADIETCIMGPNIYGHGINIYTKLESIIGSAIVVITRDFAEFDYTGRVEFSDDIGAIQNNLYDMMSLVSAICKLCPDAIIINQVYPTELTTRWAYVAANESEPAWNSGRFIGLGTAVHSARFKRGLAAKLGVSPTDCEAVILGREGRTSVPIWSSVSVAGVKLQDLNEDIGTDEDKDNYVLLHIDSAGMDELLMRHRGEPSNYAPAVIMARLVYAILHNTREVFTICTFVRGCRHGEKQDVFMSLPCVIGRTGVQRIVKQRMSDSEKEAMQDSAQQIFDYYIQFETGNFVHGSDSEDVSSDEERDGRRRRSPIADHIKDMDYEDYTGSCLTKCTCEDKCKGNKRAAGVDAQVCAKCCGGVSKCVNSKGYRRRRIFPSGKLRDSNELERDSKASSVSETCNDESTLRSPTDCQILSEFQRSIDLTCTKESISCQCDDEDCKSVVEDGTSTYSGNSKNCIETNSIGI